MNFKEMIQEDIKQFLNLEELGETHIFNQREITCIIDDNEKLNRGTHLKKEYQNGIFKAQLLIYVTGKDFGPLPYPGSLVMLDGKRYTIIEAINEEGIYSISLEANRT